MVGRLVLAATLIATAGCRGRHHVTSSVIAPDGAWLDPSAEPEALSSLRALQVRAGALYASDGGPALNEPRDTAMVWPRVVVDASPSRVRLVCDDDRVRVLLWVDRGALAMVATGPALAAPSLVGTPDPWTPGIHLDPGRVVDVLGPAVDDRIRIRVAGLFLEGEGWLPASSIGEVYALAPGERRGPVGGEIPVAAAFRAAPDGEVVGRVGKGPNVGNTLHVELAGDPREGWVLARYTEKDVALVGWVRVEELALYPEPLVLGEGFGMGGRGTGGPAEPTVLLHRGDRLLDPGSATPIGVVLQDLELTCIGACDGSHPEVRVGACAGWIDLRVE
ncbi:MAG: hypothetical protein H6738_17140 [Alphaproteobacteria bacterium]|nr:hypothetical protein [Alphaproteobacteria bacterium]MCB9698510.1 hypothetical protein [Alphaproteobacteria bacterium]